MIDAAPLPPVVATSGHSLQYKTIAMVGASGQLGSRLVPALRGMGATVIVLGRDPARLSKQFPSFESGATSDFASFAADRHFDAVIDLATLNNAASKSLEEFRSVNVERTTTLAALAQAAGVPLFVSLSSTHAIDLYTTHPYAISKREARERLLGPEFPSARLVVLPKVVTAAPGSLQARLWGLLGALKPVALLADVEAVVTQVVAAGPAAPRESYVKPIGAREFAALSRAIDICLALAILVGAGALMLLLALWVRCDSDGPVIFAQRRVGRHEALFTLYKFRTMAFGTREVGTHEITTASVTKVGAMLRHLKLDELPQLLNILRGELSFVGPRPCLPVQEELIERRRAAGVFEIRPGLTGLAQIHDVDMSDPARLVEWDARYTRLRRLLLDLRILGQTFLGRGKGDRTSR